MENVNLGVTVEFETTKSSNIPVIGKRKRLKVNGHWETLYVNRIEVERKFDEERTDYDVRPYTVYHFVGTITYGPYQI